MKNLWIRKTFIGALFTVLFIGELSFQISTNDERTLVNLAAQEQAELDSVLTRADVIAERRRAEKRSEPLEQGKASYVELNRRAAQKRELYEPYSDKIVMADKQIDEAWRPYKEFIAQRQELIRAEFKQRRDSAKSFLGLLTGIQYGVSASLLAIGLAFFSTLVFDRWHWILFMASFVAQYAACLMIYHGAMLKFNDERQAVAFAFMFLSCAPLAFHYGTLLFEKERLGEQPMATVKTLEHTESVSRTQTLTERTEQFPVKTQKSKETKPATLDDICMLVAAGKSDLSEREIAKLFHATRYEANKKIKLFRHSPTLLEDISQACIEWPENQPNGRPVVDREIEKDG